MSHEIEQAEDGTAAVMVVGEPAWHRLGELKETPATIAEALELSHCGGWDVHTVRIFGERGDRSGMSARTIQFLGKDGQPATYGTVRTNPFTGELEGLGTVGTLWTPVQNEDAASLGQSILDEQAKANIHTMGSLEGGRTFFMSIKLNEDILVGGEDAINLYLGIANRHDGKGALTAFVSPVRPVCKNTVDAAVRGAKQKWSMRHVGDVEGKVQEARESLDLTWKYAEKLEDVFNKMVQDPFSEKEMQDLLKQIIPDPKTDQQGWIDRASAQRSSVMGLFLEAETCEFGRGTKYAAYNAVAEYADWYRPGSEERRAREALGLGVNQHLKPQAFKLLTGARR